jgi:two-component system, LytTR family, sensor kinase
MQAIKRISNYWWCQIVGWGANMMVNVFFAWTFRGTISSLFVWRVLILTALGVLLTHMMRWLLLKWNVLQKSFEKQAIYFFTITVSFSVLLALLQQMIYTAFDLFEPGEQKFSFASRLIGNSFNSFVTLLVWNLIYFIYHYVERVRKQQIESLKAESLIRELQLQTIKSHINPHFIFNSLNSIRALVDENPGRARTAITELSNILRSSMQAEKAETVPFEKELNIVKDYLALEQMRFEERLKVKFEIDENTLDQPVPPMMLQTLVENAIKHGISKNVVGGEVQVVSRFTEFHHELIIRNTGSLNGSYNSDGFGVSSTMDRLKLMFGDKASFVLKNTNETHVEAIVQMPINI